MSPAEGEAYQELPHENDLPNPLDDHCLFPFHCPRHDRTDRTVRTVPGLLCRCGVRLSDKRFKQYVQDFNASYWGMLTFVDDPSVEKAMQDFHVDLTDYQLGRDNGDQIKRRAVELVTACRKSVEPATRYTRTKKTICSIETLFSLPVRAANSMLWKCKNRENLSGISGQELHTAPNPLESSDLDVRAIMEAAR